MKTKPIFILCLVLTLTGCKTFGTHTENGGRNVAKTGTGVLMVSSVFPPLIPVGFALGVPFWMIGAPMYYGGCAIAGDKPDKRPFDL